MKNGLKTFSIVILFVVIAGAGIYFAKSKVNKDNTNTNQAVTSENTNTNQSATNSNTNSVANSNSSNTNANKKISTDIILFYGVTCPHCKKVEQFISDNKVDQILDFQNLEVYNNKQNAALMTEKQNQCKDLSDDDKGGVPFLYSSEKCVVGDQPIIDYLKEKAGV